MRYQHVTCGHFVERLNRFVARVEMDGQIYTVHVKNTGRCRELLVPGAAVWCRYVGMPSRKTAYDLLSVRKNGRLINIDSQAPNAVALEWLQGGGMGQLDKLRPESVYGDSRLDFSFTKAGRPCLLEVKGVTLEQNNVCAFPDAPTTRGTKHLRELCRAVSDGYGAYILFVVQMTGVSYLTPNIQTDPEFAGWLRKARECGVKILAMDCTVTPDTIAIRQDVPVRLDEVWEGEK